MKKISKPKIKVGERPSLKYAAHVADAWQKEGEKALKTISKSQHELGTKYARAQIKEHGIRGRDAGAAGEVYDNLLRELEIEHRIIEGTDKRFVIRTRGCPFLDEWRKEDTVDPKLCEGFGKSFVQGICEAVNPKLKYNITKMMSKGDLYCEERIEL